MKRIILIAAAAVLLLPIVLLLILSASPTAKVEPVKQVGAATPIKVQVASPHGVRSIRVLLDQNGRRFVVDEKKNASRFFVFGGSEPPQDFTLTAGKSKAPELNEGKAQLIVEVKANDFRASKATVVQDVLISLQPPVVSADGAQHYINQGGSELVTFQVTGDWTEAGVKVGPYTFRSFPLPGADTTKSERFSLFAFPWDVPADTVPLVYARNGAGEEATASFWYKIFPKKFRSRELPLEDAFLQKVAAELDPRGTGSLQDRFLRVNRDLRKANNQQLANLRFKTSEEVLWNGPFYRLGKVESFFADQRTYIYKGQKIDQQMHLGFDLSDVQASPVKAANSGKVVHAGPLGIYGNCIVLDHGYGLQSIYGHLRQIDVKIGDLVQKEQVMGRSGATGLAGGDHLHFSMQVDGIQVQPIEWWDEHWIKDRILSKLPVKKT